MKAEVRITLRFLFSFLLLASVVTAFAQDQAKPSEEAPLETLEGAEDNSDIPARTVRFDLDKVPVNGGNDVEVLSVDRHWKQGYGFRFQGKTLKLRLSPGNYKVRTRSYDQYNYTSKWSPWRDFEVEYKPPTEIYPAPGQLIRPISKENEKLIFEWPARKGIGLYLFELQDSSGKTILKKLTKSYFLDTQLPINTKYRWSIQPLFSPEQAKRTDLKRVFNNFEITNPAERLTPINVQVETFENVFKYEFEFVRVLSDNETSPPSIVQSAVPEFRAGVEPGEYEIRVRSVYIDGKKTDWGPPRKVYVPFLFAIPLAPAKGTVFPGKHPFKNIVNVECKPMNGAGWYVAYIYNDKGEIIQKTKSKTPKIEVTLPAGAKYQYHMQAYGLTESEREPPPVGDRTTPFSIADYISHKFSPAEEPSDLYGWAHYIGSMVSYISKSTDNNSLTTTQIFGGSGEIAAGYWDRGSRYGALGFWNLSGFNMRNQNFQYLTVGLQGGYRWVIDQARARIWFGVARKELPEIITRPGTDYFDLQRVKTNGAFLQGSYLRPWDDKYSLYFNGNFYKSMGYNSTPNGLPLDTMTSYQLGVSISRDLGKKYRGRIGYTYKNEFVRYATYEPLGDNQVLISGSYISFLLEFALNEPDEY